MARKAREKSSTGIYAVLLTAADADRKLFYDDDDYNEFITRIYDMPDEPVLAFALCERAVCLVCRENERGIGWTIKPLTTSYAHYYGECYDNNGGLFERRFKSEPLETAEALAKALACVHRLCEGIGAEGFTGLYVDDELALPQLALDAMGGRDAYDAAMREDFALTTFFMPVTGEKPAKKAAEKKRAPKAADKAEKKKPEPKPVEKPEKKKPEPKPVEKPEKKKPEPKAAEKPEKKPEPKPVEKPEKKKSEPKAAEKKPALGPEKAPAPAKKKKSMPSWLL